MAAERVFYGENSTGVGGDVLSVTAQAAYMVGASAMGPEPFAVTPRDRLLAWLLVVSCPTIGLLVPNQKPQMLPAAATTVAIVMAIRRFDDFRREDAMLALTAAAFAVASKATFILSAGFAVGVCLAAGRKSKRMASVLAVGAATFALLPLPLLLRNLAFYGDPLSPLLERFRAHPNPELTAFALYLKTMAGEPTIRNLARLSFDLVVTVHPAAFTTVLGIGALAFIAALPAQPRTRLLLWAAFGAGTLGVVLGQLAPRFFLEPFLWAGAAAVAASWTLRKRLLLGGLALQGVLTMITALVGAITLFPGALTPGLRHAVLSSAAAGFTEDEWLNQVLPPDAVFLANSRFHLFNSRPFAVCDTVTSTAGPRADENMMRLLVERNVTHLVIDTPLNDAFTRLAARCGQRIAGPQQLKLATRNPFNRVDYQSEVFRLNDCLTANR
jgi:hypothetical protein